jgi:hypothetical protein
VVPLEKFHEHKISKMRTHCAPGEASFLFSGFLVLPTAKAIFGHHPRT